MKVEQIDMIQTDNILDYLSHYFKTLDFGFRMRCYRQNEFEETPEL